MKDSRVWTMWRGSDSEVLKMKYDVIQPIGVWQKSSLHKKYKHHYKV